MQRVHSDPSDPFAERFYNALVTDHRADTQTERAQDSNPPRCILYDACQMSAASFPLISLGICCRFAVLDCVQFGNDDIEMVPKRRALT